ncbi:Glycosyl_transferase family 2 protein [Hexamita inflata]|uniref:Glycosyl transferase family 2 protein n=1 Tax=Hexamita inflata TaxID=28002 RepID=A0AA86RD97_9EUKA|nr:Glycosyl transferase family 2 protein [Hexamita inflata]
MQILIQTILQTQIDISVIIPAYNAEKYIQTAVMSVISQSLESKEIIVVNDGSTDSTRDILVEMQKTYTQLAVYHMEENKGLFYVRQYGVNKSNGEYLLHLDADDSLRHDNVLRDLLNFTAEKPDVLHFHHQAVQYYPDNTSKEINWWGNGQVESADSSNMLSHLVYAKIHWLIHGKLVKRSVFVEALGLINDTRHLIYGEDEIQCIAIFSIAKSYKGIPYVGYNFNHREDSVTGQRTRSLKTLLKVIEDYFATRDLVQKFLPTYLFDLRNRVTKDYNKNLEALARFNDSSIAEVCQKYKARGIETFSYCLDIKVSE